jgi:O-methyltransferase involved in polyketide biosynthesis
VWKFGLNPEDVAAFVGEYSWRLVEQAGPEYYLHNYIQPAGRDLAVSELELSAYAEKT